MNFVPLQILPAAQLNALDARKADLDPVTGKVLASQLPDLSLVVHQTSDAAIAAALAAAQTAQTEAVTAQNTATASQNSATTAQTAAIASQSTATTAQATATAASTAATAALAAAAAAIPLTQRGAALGVATLGSDGKIIATQLPAIGGSGPAFLRPLSADFLTWVNKGFSTATDTDSGLLVRPELLGPNSGNVLTGCFRTLPVGDFDIEIIVAKGGLDWPYFSCGVALRESSSNRLLTAMQGKMYFVDPAISSLSGDWSGVCFQQWTNPNSIGVSQGVPCDTGEIHYRVTRVGTAFTIRMRRGFFVPWIGIWGITPDVIAFDQIGFSCNVTNYGTYANFPEQPFVVRHFGAVLV